MQLQGSGVTNYASASDAPSYAFTTATTEFDDELLRRNILTDAQVLATKGASDATIHKLLQHSSNETTTTTTADDDLNVDKKESGHDSDADDSYDDFDDDEIMQRYRQRRCRFDQLACAVTNDVVRIDRSDWTHQVNDASHERWVVVCLSSTPCTTGRMEACVQSLAARSDLHNIKWCVIDAKHAFEREWPSQYLPTLFLYRHGKMQHQLLSLSKTMTTTELAALLQAHGVYDG